MRMLRTEWESEYINATRSRAGGVLAVGGEVAVMRGAWY
jgi:hypothetical protein